MGESKRRRKNDSVNSGRTVGRPRKVDGPRVPYDEIDKLLVHGEVVPTEAGKGTAVVYPSHRELARRYGCSHSLIATYSKKHDCLRRRTEAKARVAVKADQKLVELRATALALSKDDALRMIDTYLVGFEKALGEGRVRYDNPTDFNTMLRLKEFILGGADSRQEIHAALSLEDLQARHKQMLQGVEATTAAERGDHERGPEAIDAGERQVGAKAPPGPLAMPLGKANGGFATVPRASTADHEPDDGDDAAHGGDTRAEDGP